MSVRVGSVMIIVISLLWGRILALNVQALPGHDPAVLVIGAAGFIGFHMIISTLSILLVLAALAATIEITGKWLY